MITDNNIKYDLNMHNNDLPDFSKTRNQFSSSITKLITHTTQESNAHEIHMPVKRKCRQSMCKKLTQNIKYDLNMHERLA